MSLTGLMAQSSFHDFTVKDISGKEFAMKSLEGKKVLVVNTASECGFTKQYADLQELYEKYEGQDFVILGFPCNDFGGQEPGSEQEIMQFCTEKFQVSFPMMSKVVIKGDDKDAIYAWLQQKELNGVENSSVRWNFHKFLIDEKGYLVKSYGSMKNPMSSDIQEWITESN